MRDLPIESLGAPTGDPASRMAQNLLLTSELVSIARALEAAGVEFIVLKGVPLAYRIFGRLDARRIRDNDILVRPGDVDRAFAALRARGYESKTPGVVLRKEFRRTNQHMLVRRLPRGPETIAELHWRAFVPRYFRVPEAVEWRQTRPFPLNGVVLTVFDEPLTLLHLAAHFTHHSFSAWVLRDVAAAWNTWHRDIDRNELLQLARDTGAEHVLEFALRAAEDLHLLVAPAPVRRSWRAASLRRLVPSWRLTETHPDPYPRWMLLAHLLTGIRWVPWYAVQRMFPTIESMSAIHRQPVSGRLYLRYVTESFRTLHRALWTGRNAPKTTESRWVRWRELPACERRQTLLAAGLIPLAAASLRVVGVHRTLRALAAPVESAAAGPADPVAAHEAVRAVRRAARHAPYGGNCLSRSIALMWLLRRRGIAADLRLGARMREGTFEAHAWVEQGGIVLNDTPDVAQRFAPFVAPAAVKPTTFESACRDRAMMS